MIKLKEILIKPISDQSLWIVRELFDKFGIDALIRNEKEALCDILKDVSWYHGLIDRETASGLLYTNLKENGYFLVRESITIADELVLSLVYDNNILHFPIIRKKFGLSFQLFNETNMVQNQKSPNIQGLDQFVLYYQQSLQDLPCLLSKKFVYGYPPLSHYCKYTANCIIHYLAYAGYDKLLERYLYTCRELLTKDCDKTWAFPLMLNIVIKKSLDGYTALHIAIKNSHISIIKIIFNFIEILIHVDNDQKESAAEFLYNKILLVRDANGNSILHTACQFNQISTLKFLYSEPCHSIMYDTMSSKYHKIRTNLFKKLLHEPNPFTGNFPIHNAAESNSLECLSTLLSLDDASANLLNFSKCTPMDLALQNKNEKCANFIESFINQRLLSKAYNHNSSHGDNDIFIYKIDRQIAENLLLKYKNATSNNISKDGIYLLRSPSDLSNQNIILSTTFQSNIFHFEITQMKSHHFCIDNGPLFLNLKSLLSHYHIISDGLPCVLYHMVLPQGINKPIPKIRPRIRYKDNSNDPSITNPTHFENDKNFDENICWKNLVRSNTQQNKDLVNHKFLNFKDVTLASEIGRGEFGSVFRGSLIVRSNLDVSPDDGITKLDVAVKTLHPDYFPADKENFLSEAQVMLGLDHDSIVKLLGICPTATSIMMVQELAQYGSLQNYLPLHKESLNPQNHFPSWASQIAAGMAYLEDCHFVHRDLAARNILVFGTERVKITDFGLSRALGLHSNYYKSTSGGKWPVKWYAPESVNFGRFSHASDVWGYGITVWEMYSFSEPPYGEMSGLEVIQALDDGYRLPKPEVCPTKVYRKLMECWSSRPHKRPKFKDLQTYFGDKILNKH